MKLSANGEAFIKDKEGLRLEAYSCSAGVFTIGWGHTKGVIRDGVKISGKFYNKITKQQAHDLFLEDIMQFELAVRRLVRVPLTQNQFDALVSFTFNLGAGALQKSTLLRKLNAGDYVGAGKEFKRWNKAGGKVVAGLTTRRKQESEMFLDQSIKEPFMAKFDYQKPDPNNEPIPFKTLPLPTAHQEYGEPVAPTNAKQNTVAAVGGVAGAAGITTVIADPQIIAPTLSFLQVVDYRVALAVVAVIVLGGLIYWIWGRK